MEAVFLRILNIALTTGWLVLAVLLLRFVLKKAPRWVNCLLWGVVALRLLLPFSLESALSLIPNAEPIPESIIITETPDVNDGFEGVDQVPGQTPNQTPDQVPDQVPDQAPDQVVDSEISGSLAPTPENSADPVQVLVFAASIVWIAGIVLMLGYGAFSYFRLKHKVRASLCKEGRVYLCDNIETPFILGVFRPRIYLPSGMADGDIPYVIAHEEAHLKRKDHLWKPLGFLLLSVYWFHPLLWVAYILLCRDIENACDEKAIKDGDTAYKVGYAEALLSCSIHRRTVMACPVAFGEVGVKSRIRAVLHYKKPAFWVIVVAILVLIITCVCFLTNPVSDKDETTTAPSTTETPATTTAPTTQTPTTPENPDAWKDKVDFENLSNGYDAETDTYQIRIVVQDIHGVGQKRADAAFAEKYGLYYSGKYYYLDYYQFDIIASMKDIEMYAKLEEVKSVLCPVPPAWKNKVDWGYNFPSGVVVDEETGKYSSIIRVKDIHGVGEKNAYAAFAEKHGIAFDPDLYYGWGLSIWASMEEIEAYAKLDEVERIWFNTYDTSGDPIVGDPEPSEPRWWQQVKTVQGITRVTKADGSVRCRFELTIHSGSNLFPILPDGTSTLENVDIASARVLIKEMNGDKDYTEYKVASWYVRNNYELFFEVDGFTAEDHGEYDMFLFFTLPEGTPHPGEECYIWALEEPWMVRYLPTTPLDYFLYRDMEHAWWQEIQRIHGITCSENADGSKSYTFGLTVNKNANDFFPANTFELILADDAYVYIQKLNQDQEHTKYGVGNLTTTDEGDISFEALGFVAEEGARYNMILFFVMPEGTPHPGEYCYVCSFEEAWTLNQN